MSGEVGVLRVLSWNVRDLLGDPLAVARVLRAAQADVVCLQEAPRWPGSRWRLAALARASGLLFVEGGRSAAGCAVLSSVRTDVREARSLRLPVDGWFIRPRGAVLARVAPVGHADVALACIHLGLTPQERARHVEILHDELAALPSAGRVVVAGDLNEPPGGPSWTAFADLAADPGPRHPTTGPTYTAKNPRRRIDAVLVGGAQVLEYDAWRADDADVVAASDHRPVLATLRLPPPHR